MGLSISNEDFVGRWSLSFSDMEFVNGKPARLGLAVQLKFFAEHGFFVQDHASIPTGGVSWLAEQLGVECDAVRHYDFSGRTSRRQCAEILQYLGFRRLKRSDREELTLWIAGELCPTGQSAGLYSSRFFCGAGTVVYTARRTRNWNGWCVRNGNIISTIG
jgi:TnpA family transposase